MPVRNTSETVYYESIRKYLKEQMDCVVESSRKGVPLLFKERGLRQARLRIDVFGIREYSGASGRSLEAIAVEVKARTVGVLLDDMLQTSKYSRVAHLCYLAQPCEFDKSTRMEALRVGVGLLSIGPKRGSTYKITPVAESKRFEPDPELLHRFLVRALKVGQCSFCHRCGIRPSSQGKAVERLPHLAKYKVFDPQKMSKTKMRSVYVCPVCRDVIGQIARAPVMAAS